ncbi:MAG: hypothetical protein WCP52_00160 [Bacteroidota bacterium]
METPIQKTEIVITTNKWLKWIIIAVVIIAVLCIGSYVIYKRGQQSVVNSQIEKTDKSQVVNWTKIVLNKTATNDSLLNENSILKEHNKTLLKSLSAYQMYQSIIRSTNVATIKQTSDSIKDKKIDSIQVVDKNGILIDYANYNNLSNSFDSCQTENKILQTTIYSDSLFIQSYVKLIQAKDSLETYTNKQCADLSKIDKSKIRRKTFWIFTGWGVAISETALFMYEAIKNVAVK